MLHKPFTVEESTLFTKVTVGGFAQNVNHSATQKCCESCTRPRCLPLSISKVDLFFKMAFLPSKNLFSFLRGHLKKQPEIPNPNMHFENLFSSKNLVYRAIENNEENEKYEEDKKFWMEKILSDPVSLAQNMDRLISPPSSNTIEAILGYIKDDLLAVFICLPAAKGESKPTPIGWLHLCAGWRQNRNCMLGIVIFEPHQGKGYGTEAINWALNWALRLQGCTQCEFEIFLLRHEK
jgi:GNAT superfamily N-acetyltransferase